MLPSKSRLPRQEFQTKGYKTTPTPFFLLKTKKNAVGYPRIGVVIGKAIYKEAVKRNFWRRQVKALILKNTQASSDFLIIFSSTKKAKLSKKQFREDLEAALNKTK